MEINPSQILFQIANFGLLLFVLTKFLYQPLLKLLEDRNQKIAAGLKAAEDNLKQKDQLEILKQKELIQAEAQAASILEAAHQKADQVGKSLLAEAKQATQIAIQKEYQILQEKIRAERAKLQSEVVDLVVNTTKQVLSGSLSQSEQHQIIDNQIQELNQLKKIK